MRVQFQRSFETRHNEQNRPFKLNESDSTFTNHIFQR